MLTFTCIRSSLCHILYMLSVCHKSSDLPPLIVLHVTLFLDNYFHISRLRKLTESISSSSSAGPSTTQPTATKSATTMSPAPAPAPQSHTHLTPKWTTARYYAGPIIESGSRECHVSTILLLLVSQLRRSPIRWTDQKKAAVNISPSVHEYTRRAAIRKE